MPTWIVVEDEPDLYEMVLAMYGTMGVDGLAFVDGEEAIEWMEEVNSGDFTEELPEFALLDIRLPGEIDGLKVGAKLRATPALQNIPIVLMTAYKLSPSEEDQAFNMSGADLLLYKPLPGHETLRDLFFQLIEGRQQQAE